MPGTVIGKTFIVHSPVGKCYIPPRPVKKTALIPDPFSTRKEKAAARQQPLPQSGFRALPSKADHQKTQQTHRPGALIRGCPNTPGSFLSFFKSFWVVFPPPSTPPPPVYKPGAARFEAEPPTRGSPSSRDPVGILGRARSPPLRVPHPNATPPRAAAATPNTHPAPPDPLLPPPPQPPSPTCTISSAGRVAPPPPPPPGCCCCC